MRNTHNQDMKNAEQQFGYRKDMIRRYNNASEGRYAFILKELQHATRQRRSLRRGQTLEIYTKKGSS